MNAMVVIMIKKIMFSSFPLSKTLENLIINNNIMGKT
jgi:hypothetical protein